MTPPSTLRIFDLHETQWQTDPVLNEHGVWVGTVCFSTGLYSQDRYRVGAKPPTPQHRPVKIRGAWYWVEEQKEEVRDE